MMPADVLEAQRTMHRSRLSSVAERLVFQNAGGRPDDGVWVPMGDPIPCQIVKAKGSETPQAVALNDLTLYRAVLPWDTILTAKDRLRIDGVDFEIHDVPNDRSERRSLRAIVSRIAGEGV